MDGGTAGEAALVRMENVAKTFANGTVALEGLTLAIEAGSFTSILGPSGCGKSTALRLIAGLGDATAGTVRLAPRTARRDIGFVFQEPTLMPWATVFDNAFLPLRLAGQPGSVAQKDIDRALDLVGLTGFANAYPRELSGGMRMRASIARALVTKPRLLLMDEPFAALDEITRFKLNDDLLALWKSEGWTVVFVTHSVFESVYLSNRILVMTPRPGRIAADIAVHAPYPRRDAGFRTSDAYNRHCREVSARLAGAMGG